MQEQLTMNEELEIKGDLSEAVSKTEDMFKSSSKIVEARRKMLNDIINSKFTSAELREDAIKYLEETANMENFMQEAADQFAEIIEKQNKLLDEMQQEYRREDIIEYGKAIRDRAMEENNLVEVAKADKFIAEMENGVSLQILFDGISKIKNKANIVNIAKNEKEFNKLWKKYVERLKKDRTYIFRNPTTMERSLTTILGSKEDARIFMTSYCKFFARQEVVSEYSVFVNELSRNIENYDNEKFIERNILVENLKEYVRLLKEQ